MMAAAQHQRSIEERLQTEFSLIKASIAGVHGTVVATSDGFLVSHDVPDFDPTDLAALLAASRALASQGIVATGRGQFREAISRGTLGYLAVYAAGDNAIVAVIGNADLNIALLHFRAHDSIERIAAYTAEFRPWSSAPVQGLATRGAPGQSLSAESRAGLPVRNRNSA